MLSRVGQTSATLCYMVAKRTQPVACNSVARCCTNMLHPFGQGCSEKNPWIDLMWYYCTVCTRLYISTVAALEECTTNCSHFHTCEARRQDYQCSCAPGFTGFHCNINIDDCASKPCVHGTCVDEINKHRCVCDSGFWGEDCSKSIPREAPGESNKRIRTYAAESWHPGNRWRGRKKPRTPTLGSLSTRTGDHDGNVSETIKPGGVLIIFLGGCAARSWKPLPYFRPKYTIFHTLFQTWLSKCNVYPVSDPL